jgi:PEP-CTERM motif
MYKRIWLAAAALFVFALTDSVKAGTFFFSTGNPDGLIGTASRPASAGKLETETADDFVLTQATRLDSATFTGLIPLGVSLGSITQVEIEFYRVFPADSNVPPSGNVPSRVNSPSDNEVDSATRDSLAGTLSFTPGINSPNFTVLNSVVNGIHPKPGEFTDGEGPVTGQEVTFNVLFTTPIVLPADHYFFRPEVGLSNGDFLWLSAPRPIVPPGTAFPPGATDLQTWIRNSDLKPDWLRIGTDITHQGPFNAAFSLSGETVPEPASLLLLGTGVAALLAWRKGRSFLGKTGQ